MSKRINLLITGLFAVSLLSLGQDAKDILKKSYRKCQSIQNGYYEMTRYEKHTDRKDTIKSSYTCYFKKLKNDTLEIF